MIEEMVKHYAGGNKAYFARQLGISPARLSKWMERDTYDAEILFEKLKDISSAWLLSGKGPMTHEEDLPDYTPPTPIADDIVEPYISQDRTKAKIVVEIDLDSDEFVRLGLSDRVVQVLKSKYQPKA